jgi:outer membrane lipoprotein-sorting protein
MVMHLKKILILFVIFIVFFTSCKSNDELYKANKKILEMKSYSAAADITVFSNKGISYYKVRHFFSFPDKIRIETMEPDFLKGKIIVGNKGKWKIYHPLIGQSFETTEPKESEEYICLGILQKSILSGEDSNYSFIKRDGIDFIQIKAMVPNGTVYRNNISVLLSRENYLPEVLEIYDSNNKLTVKVLYSDFKYNIEIKDSIFEI